VSKSPDGVVSGYISDNINNNFFESGTKLNNSGSQESQTLKLN